MALLKQPVATGILLLIAFFLERTFDPDFARVLIFMLFTTFALWTIDLLVADKKTTFPIEKTQSNRFNAVLIGIVVTVIFAFLTTQLVSIYTSGSFSISQTLSVFSSSELVFANNALIQFIAIGLVIAFIETNLFFGVLLEGSHLFLKNTLFPALRKLGLNVSDSDQFDMTNIGLWILVIFIASLFTGYHFNSKGLEDIKLAIVFLFAVLSAWMVIYYREQKQAILVHTFTNSAAMYIALYN
jgi:hypothetical protein